MPAIGSILLDTSVVIAALRRMVGIREHLQSAEVLWLPLFALGELEYGMRRSSQPEKHREAISAFLQGVDTLYPSAATAEEYGKIKAELAMAGTPIPENDIWIAALARENNLPLATRDEHFQRVQRLTVLNWP